MTNSKEFHPPIIVFCPKCGMPIFPTLRPNKLLCLINGSKLSCAACNTVFDVHIELTDRDAEQRDEAGKGRAAEPSCKVCGHWIGVDGHVNVADDDGHVIVTAAYCAKHYAELGSV